MLCVTCCILDDYNDCVRLLDHDHMHEICFMIIDHPTNIIYTTYMVLRKIINYYTVSLSGQLKLYTHDQRCIVLSLVCTHVPPYYTLGQVPLYFACYI